MITINNDSLCIRINHPEPQQERENIIKAIAAAIRWRAAYSENYNGDDFNLYTLSCLLAQLSNDA